MARIVLKPAGILMLLGVFAVLALLALTPRWLRQRLPGGVARVELPIRDKDAVPWTLSAPTDSHDGAAKTVDLRDGPEGATKAIQLTVNKEDAEKSWNVQAYHDIPVPVGAGEPWEVRFYGRSPQSRKFTVAFELSREPFTRNLDGEVQLTPQWQHFVLPFTTNRAYAAREAKVSLQVGKATGVFEFTGVELVRTGSTAAGGAGGQK